MTGLKGKTVFISGASSGIGKASAEAFAMAGTRLILCARSIDKITALAEKLKEHYETECMVIKLDVRDRQAVEEAIAECEAARLQVKPWYKRIAKRIKSWF